MNPRHNAIVRAIYMNATPGAAGGGEKPKPEGGGENKNTDPDAGPVQLPPDQHPRFLELERIGKKSDDAVVNELLAQGADPAFIGIASAPPPPDPTAAPAAPIQAPPPNVSAPPAATAAPSASPAPTSTPAPGVDFSALLANAGNEPIPLDALDSLRVRVRVDGQMRDMTVADMRRTVQLDGAAQKRLEEATRLLDQARALAKEGGGSEGSAGSPPASPPVGDDGGDKPGNTPARDPRVTKLVNALFVGDENAAAEVVGQLFTQPKGGANVDPNTIAGQLAPMIRQQLSNEDAMTVFKRDFKDIVGDPFLAEVADRYLAEELAAGQPYADALGKAGAATRDWLASKGLKGTTTEPPAGSDLDGKLKQKQEIDNVSGANARAHTEEPRVESRSETIAEMAKARGIG